MNNNKVPSEEDYARADAAMNYKNRGLSEVSDRITKRYHDRGIHEFFLFFSSATNKFVAYVFYLTNRMIVEGEESGLSSEIKESILDELTAVGRGDRDMLNVIVEYDSHENVEQNYDGDYFSRLR